MREMDEERTGLERESGEEAGGKNVEGALSGSVVRQFEECMCRCTR